MTRKADFYVTRETNTHDLGDEWKESGYYGKVISKEKVPGGFKYGIKIPDGFVPPDRLDYYRGGF